MLEDCPVISSPLAVRNVSAEPRSSLYRKTSPETAPSTGRSAVGLIRSEACRPRHLGSRLLQVQPDLTIVCHCSVCAHYGAMPAPGYIHRHQRAARSECMSASSFGGAKQGGRGKPTVAVKLPVPALPRRLLRAPTKIHLERVVEPAMTPQGCSHASLAPGYRKNCGQSLSLYQRSKALPCSRGWSPRR